ncbi:MAG TPA: MarR family transcriptional regulator [Actinomycetota bacterium]|nr:MarR family transcriptional regulator [Actinomycetota bacterium]
MDERFEAWVALLEAHAAVMDALDRALQDEGGIPLAWHEVLARLAAQPEGRMRMRDLAREVLLTKSGISRLVDRLQEAGLVTRAECDTDRRVTYATITPDGRRALRAAGPAFRRTFEERFGRHLSEDEARSLRSTLARVSGRS